MSIIRVQKNSNYSVISNVHLQDESLSWKAKGILSYLLSKPDDWQVYTAQLKKASKDGKDATSSGLRELIDAGYVTRDIIRDKAGRITGRDYVVHECPKVAERSSNKGVEPETENPSLDNPALGIPGQDKPSLLNTDYIKDGIKENTDDIQGPSPSLSCEVLSSLMALVPERYNKPSVKKTIEKGLGSHTEGSIRSAVLYTIAHSNGGTWQKFKAYLGKCIEFGWADGWEPYQESQIDQDVIRDRFRKMSDQDLKVLSGSGNQWAIRELENRKQEVS